MRLNRALAHRDMQPEQFPANALCSPGAVVLGQALDQVYDVVCQRRRVSGWTMRSECFHAQSLPARQNKQEPIALSECGAFDLLVVEDDQVLAQESVPDHEFRFAECEMSGRIRQRRVVAWSDPAAKRLWEAHEEQVENAAEEENHGLPF